MKERGNYVPPPYVPLRNSDADAEVTNTTQNLEIDVSESTKDDTRQWSSGICACFDDMQSCMLLFVLQTLILLQEPNVLKLPCATSLGHELGSIVYGEDPLDNGLKGTCGFTEVLFWLHRYCRFVLSMLHLWQKREILGSGTFVGPCLTHCISWALVNTICCFATNGVLLGLPGCFMSCYACGYRRSLRTKYNLQEAPCGDFLTHFFCHLCAICQEYREIRERSSSSYPPDMKMAITDAPLAQTMEPDN